MTSGAYAISQVWRSHILVEWIPTHEILDAVAYLKQKLEATDSEVTKEHPGRPELLSRT